MNSKTLLGQTFQSLGWILFILFLGLFFDSGYFSKNYFEHSQWINTVCVILVFIYCYYKGTSRTREQLIYALFIGVIGEYFFSLILGMYSYRLYNVPHYIPFGHALVFLGVYSFSKKSKVKLNAEKINLFLTIFIAVYAFVFLVFKKDVFGFVMTLLVFYSLRKYPKEKLFYLTMYVVVVYAELIGTSLNTWSWPKIAFNTFEFLPSGNPPSGICLFYYGLDRGTMSFYKRRHKLAWARLKRIRAIEN